MIVKIVDGYGSGCKTEAEQGEFLDSFRSFLQGFGLGVQKISSENPTGGPITLAVCDDTETDWLISIFASLAEDLSAYHGHGVTLRLEIEGVSEPITVAG